MPAAMPIPLPRARLPLAGALILVVLVQAGAGLFAQWRAARAEHAMAARLEQAAAGLDSLREAQAAFGREVQEWKNMLLRGADPAALERHRAGHLAAGERVAAALAAAGQGGIAPPGALEALARGHAALRAAYGAALAGRDLAAPGAQAAADGAVRGADRDLAARMDAAAEGFAAHHAATLREARAAAAERQAVLRMVMLASGGLAAVLVLALLALLLRAR